MDQACIQSSLSSRLPAHRTWKEQKKPSSALSVGTHPGRRWNGFPRRQVGRKPSTVGQSQAGEETGQEEQLVASKSPEPRAAWGAGSRVSGPRRCLSLASPVGL